MAVSLNAHNKITDTRITEYRRKCKMLTRRELNRIKKTADMERGLRKDMDIISLGSFCDKPSVHFTEEAFKYRFKHYKTENITDKYNELSVNWNGFYIFCLVNRRVSND